MVFGWGVYLLDFELRLGGVPLQSHASWKIIWDSRKRPYTCDLLKMNIPNIALARWKKKLINNNHYTATTKSAHKESAIKAKSRLKSLLHWNPKKKKTQKDKKLFKNKLTYAPVGLSTCSATPGAHKEHFHFSYHEFLWGW